MLVSLAASWPSSLASTGSHRWEPAEGPGSGSFSTEETRRQIQSN